MIVAYNFWSGIFTVAGARMWIRIARETLGRGEQKWGQFLCIRLVFVAFAGAVAAAMAIGRRYSALVEL